MREQGSEKRGDGKKCVSAHAGWRIKIVYYLCNSDQLRGARGGIMPILKMRKLQLREDKKPSKLSSRIRAPKPNPYT